MADDKGKKDGKGKKDDKKEEKPSTMDKVADATQKAGNFMEKFQTGGALAGVGAALLGVFGNNRGREKSTLGGETKEKGLTDWTPPMFSKEDDIEYNGVIASHPDRNLRAIERNFRQRLEREGYDPDEYRKVLIGSRRDFLNRVNNPGPENKSGGITFKKITISDPAIEFFDQLIDEHSAGGTADEIFSHQLEVAKGWGLVEKTGTIKKTFIVSRKHKLPTLAIMFLIIVVILCGSYWLLYFLFERIN